MLGKSLIQSRLSFLPLHLTISILEFHMLMHPSHLGYISRTDVSSEIFFRFPKMIPLSRVMWGSDHKTLGPNNDRRVNAV